MATPLDDMDREILSILRREGRKPFTKIADDLDVSEGTVRNRVDRMVEEGVIERFTVATRTGNVQAMIEIGVTIDADTSQVGDLMAGWDEVDYVWQVSGEEDVVLVVDVADSNGVNELMTRARELEEVVSTQTRLILNEQIG